MKVKCTGEYKPHTPLDGSAGIDLYNNDKDITIYEGQSYKINTKTSMEIPAGYVGLVFPRSGLGFKGLDLINSVGVIDENYRGEIMVKVILHPKGHSTMYSRNSMTIKVGERFAQIVIVPYHTAKLNFVKELSETNRGTDGLGSSGTK